MANPHDTKYWLGKYNLHRRNAVGRGIEFLLTFEEWFELWLKSDQINNRGVRKGQYVMARFGDKGAYAVGNVRICTAAENNAEKWARLEVREKISTALLGNTHTLGRKLTSEECEEQSKRTIKMWQDPEFRETMHNARIGRVQPLETRQKISKSSIGKKMSGEACAKMSVAKKDKPLSAEHCAALSVAQKERWRKWREAKARETENRPSL